MKHNETIRKEKKRRVMNLEERKIIGEKKNLKCPILSPKLLFLSISANASSIFSFSFCICLHLPFYSLSSLPTHSYHIIITLFFNTIYSIN